MGKTCSKLTMPQLHELCHKYKIVSPTNLPTMTKDQILVEVKSFIQFTMNKYKGRRKSQPNILQNSEGGPPQSS